MNRTLARAWRTPLIAALAVAGCGGDSFVPVPDLGCVFSNCKNSAELPLQDLAPSIEVRQAGTRVTTAAEMGYRANLLTSVNLSGGDVYVMSTGSQSMSLPGTAQPPFVYTGAFDGQPAQPAVTVDFRRGANVYRSSVTPPAEFSVVSPAGAVTLDKSAGQLLVELSIPGGTSGVRAVVTGNCAHSDGATRPVDGYTVNTAVLSSTSATTTYRIDTIALHNLLNTPNAPPSTVTATGCDLTVTWRREVEGTIPAEFYGGRIVGVTSQPMAVRFNADR